MAQTTPSQIPLSQDQLKSQYLNLAESQNSILNVNLDPVIQVQSNVYAGMFSGLYSNVYLYGQQIFPISTSGIYVPYHLASWAFPPLSAGAYALGTCQLTETLTGDITIPANTQLQDQFNNIYVTMNAVEILAGNLGTISYRSQDARSGLQLSPGATLSLGTPIDGVTELEVISMNDGADAETFPNGSKRLLSSIQNPPEGGNRTDYENWALSSDSSITGVTVNNYVDTYKNTYVNVFVLGGQLNIESLLSTPAVQYNRSVNPATIAICDNYIEARRPETDLVTVDSVTTYTISGAIGVAVKLIPGYTLTDIDPGTGLTIEQLIVREVRRPIVLTSQNPTLNIDDGLYYIPRETIFQSMINNLNANPLNPGQIAQIIINMTLTLVASFGIPVPNPKTSQQIIYDLPPNQPNATVTTI